MTRLALVVSALAAACGDDGGSGAADANVDISSVTYEPCDPATRIGGFEVALTDEFTGVQGQVYDATLPAAVPTTIATDGACKLVSAPNYTCTPTCAASDVCNAEQTCVPYPVAHSVGVVEVAGLLAAVEMTPRSPTYFYSSTATLPNPGYTPGAVIALFADGGDYTAFSLTAYGVEALALSAETYTVARDQPLALAWTAPSVSGSAQVTISLNINGHGLVGSHVECTVPDTGAYTIPAGLITQLIDAGTSGFPTITLARTSTDSATITPGCVDLRVHSTIKRDVTIPGVQSCNDDDDCTPPATCQGDLTCGS